MSCSARRVASVVKASRGGCGAFEGTIARDLSTRYSELLPSWRVVEALQSLFEAPPPAAGEFGALRSALKLPETPQLVVLSQSGDVDRSQPARPLVLEGERPLGSVLEELRARGWRRVLCEGGPRVIGELLRQSLLDDM